MHTYHCITHKYIHTYIHTYILLYYTHSSDKINPQSAGLRLGLLHVGHSHFQVCLLCVKGGGGGGGGGHKNNLYINFPTTFFKKIFLFFFYVCIQLSSVPFPVPLPPAPSLSLSLSLSLLLPLRLSSSTEGTPTTLCIGPTLRFANGYTELTYR